MDLLELLYYTHAPAEVIDWVITAGAEISLGNTQDEALALIGAVPDTGYPTTMLWLESLSERQSYEVTQGVVAMLIDLARPHPDLMDRLEIKIIEVEYPDREKERP